MYTIYGIKNCDTVKKALAHLDKNGAQYEFVDFKKTPPTKELITKWQKFMKDWPVNRRGPTFRKIKDAFEAGRDTAKISLLIESSSAIKRPLIEKKGKPLVAGYDSEIYKDIK
ncbi:MAG: arsenate reductase [Halobacteriovorax sp.]|mgnify:FL=1|nr:arsenate reductase [Halobacteriovorax sp.]